MVNLSQNILTTDEQCSIRCVPPVSDIDQSQLIEVIDSHEQQGIMEVRSAATD